MILQNDNLVAALSPAEWDYIVKCLMLRPYGEVAGLVNKLKAQLETPGEQNGNG